MREGRQGEVRKDGEREGGGGTWRERQEEEDEPQEKIRSGDCGVQRHYKGSSGGCVGGNWQPGRTSALTCGCPLLSLYLVCIMCLPIEFLANVPEHVFH